MEWVGVMDIHAVNTLRWLESHIIVAWVVVLPKCSHLRVEQWAGIPTNSLKQIQVTFEINAKLTSWRSGDTCIIS